MEVGPLDRPYNSILNQLPNLLGGFSKISSLSLITTSLDALQVFQKALQTHPNVNELTLVTQWCSGDKSELVDTKNRPGLIFRTIFSHMMPLSACTPIATTKITINNFNLRYADRFPMQAVASKSLELLSVETCMAPEGLFALLSEPQQLPFRLKTLRWFHRHTAKPHTLIAFERLLEELHDLECLHVELGVSHKIPEPRSISHFGSSLRSLLVQGQDSQSTLLGYKPEELDQICTECIGLRVLSVALPSMYLSEKCPLSTWEVFLDSTRKLPNLITLNIQTWPKTLVCLPELHRNRWSEEMRIYESQLQRIARMIFNASDTEAKTRGRGLGHRSMLAVIAFGANDTSL